MKRLCTLLLALCLSLCILAFPAHAADRISANSWRYSNGTLTAPKDVTPLAASHPDATLLGIDVSHHQGEIDWAAVKESDVDFVIIRCGYGMDETGQDDRYFEYNASECERLGIPYGVYIYSYADSVERAQSEAEHVLRLINGRKLSFPVYFDIEDDTTKEADHAAIASTFCNQIEAAGYPVGVYANLDWWKNRLTDPCFDNWHRWVAHYSESCGYTGEYAMWQFTDSGTVDGIEGNVDMNYLIGSPADHGTSTVQHNYEGIVHAPTCTEQGYTVHTCSICGNSYSANATAALGHSWDEGVVTTAATKKEPGVRTYTCKVCSASKTEEIPPLGPDMYRISGENRSETALGAANALKEVLETDSFDTIIIASGTNFADALSGSYLAAKESAPILLYTKGYEDELAEYIKKNLTTGGTVYILGGTSSVPETTEKALADFRTERLAGADRFETNLKILAAAGVSGDEILVCTAYNFADSLSASAVGKPILLVGGNLNSTQKALLDGLSGNDLAIIGGTNSVSESLETALAAYGNVSRISGSSREETSVAVAKRFFDNPQHVVLAYSRNFPDGLCGGPLAHALGAPLLLTSSGAESAAANYVSQLDIDSGVVLGGTASLPDKCAKTVLGIS